LRPGRLLAYEVDYPNKCKLTKQFHVAESFLGSWNSLSRSI